MCPAASLLPLSLSNHITRLCAILCSYLRALCGAIFMCDAGDQARVKTVVEQKGRKWEHVIAFNFRYVVLRVRRHIPPPQQLYHRVKAVFDFFADQEDSEKHQPLFNKEAKKKAKLVLEAILRGELSDPPGAEWYVRKTNQRGEVMVDRDGLWLYRCFRGTNLTESMHQSLTTAFGHTRAGPE